MSEPTSKGNIVFHRDVSKKDYIHQTYTVCWLSATVVNVLFLIAKEKGGLAYDFGVE